MKTTESASRTLSKEDMLKLFSRMIAFPLLCFFVSLRAFAVGTSLFGLFALSSCKMDEPPMISAFVSSYFSDNRGEFQNSPLSQEQDLLFLETDQSFTIDLILPGSIKDPGWSREAYQGLMDLQHLYQAKIRVVENVRENQSHHEIAQLLKNPPELLLAYGGEFVAALDQFVEKYPETDFVSMDSHGGNNRNFGSIYFDSFSTAFIAGAIAAVKSQTKHVAIVIGAKMPNTIYDAAAFSRGVRYVDPSVRSQHLWVGSWTDQYLASETIKKAIPQGIDVFAVNTYMGDREALAEIARAGLSCIAFHEDKSLWAPHAVLTSVQVNHHRLVQFAVQRAFEGRWNGRHHLLGARDGAVTLAPLNPDHLSELQRKKILDIWTKLTNGEIIGVF